MSIKVWKDIYAWSFWFSDDTENKIFGIIIEKNWRLILQLEKEFHPKQNYASTWKRVFQSRKNKTILWEIMTDNIRPEKQNIVLSWAKYFDGWMKVKEYDFDYMIFDCCFESNENTYFDKIKFTFKELPIFTWDWWVIEQVDQYDKNHQITQTTLKYKQQQWYEYDITDMKIIFSHGLTYKPLQDRCDVNWKTMQKYKGLNIENNQSVIVLFDNGKSIFDIEEIIKKINSFFVIVFWSLVKFDDVLLYVEWQNKLHEIKVIPNSWFFYNNQNIETKYNHDMLFQLKDLKDKFWWILESWLFNNPIQNACDLYISVIKRNQYLILENQFLNLVQALEQILTISSEQISSFQKSEIKKKIKLKEVLTDEEFKYILIASSKESFEAQIKNTLKDLWFDKKLHCKDIHTKVVKMRNSLSHWDSLSNTTDYDDLYNCTEILHSLVRVLIVRHFISEYIDLQSILKNQIEVINQNLKIQ